MRRRILTIAVTLIVLVVVVSLGSLAYTTLRPTVVERSVDIDASASDVWAALTDLDAYPEWNPFIVSSTGEIRVGATLTNTLDNDGSTMVFEPEILVADTGRELRWIGRFGVRGIVDGEHYFTIEPLGDGTVRFTQGEKFSGILVPVAGSALDVADGFDAMNQALKKRVE